MGQKGTGACGVGLPATPGQTKKVNISEMLDRQQNVVRTLLLDALIGSRNPLPFVPERVEHICSGFSFGVEDILGQLEEKGVIVRDENKAVVAVYPVSALPTRHRVQLADGRTLYAMCAIDAIGAAFTTNQDATVESSCLHCDTSIRLRLVSGRLQEVEPGSVHVLHVDLRKYRNWAADC